MSKRKHAKVWALPAEYWQDKQYVSGESISPNAVGTYYASSLEYGCLCTPQILNAGDLVAPAYDDLRSVFKPKKSYGTFGALLADEDQNDYQLEVSRQVVELPTVSDVQAVSDSLSAEMILSDIEELGLVYTATDGSKISYKDALQMMHSWRSHNDTIQRRITDLVKDQGYAPEIRNGKIVPKKYPDYLIEEISHLARQKKSVTGFNLKITWVGKHTISLDENYVSCSSTQTELDELIRRVNYKRKKTHLQGTVRAGSVIVPIQTREQLQTVIAALKKLVERPTLSTWPSRVFKSWIPLERVVREKDPD